MSNVSRRPGRPADANSEDVRRQIIDIATRHFGTYGYAQTTVKKVADEMAITSGAVYHYFPSKQNLLEALSVELISSAVARLRRAAEANADFVDRVIAVIDELDRIHRDEPEIAELTLVVTNDVARYPELRVAHEKSIALYSGLCRWLVDSAIDRGELRADVDARSVVDMLNGSLSGVINMLSLLPERHRPAMIDAAKRLFRGQLFVAA